MSESADASWNGDSVSSRELERWKTDFDESLEKGVLGWSLLHYVSSKGAAPLVSLLCEKGEPVDAKNKNGQTPLHLASFAGHVDVCDILLEHGANVNSKNMTDEWTPLQYASFNGHLQVATSLLQRGADVNLKDVNERTPLYRARFKDHSALCTLLQEHGGVL